MKRLLLTLLALLAGPIALAQTAQTIAVNRNDSGTPLYTATPAGLNWASCDDYDSGQIMKNLYGCLNPGFEPPQVRQAWTLAATTSTTSFQATYSFDMVTSGYWIGSTVEVVGSPSAGAELGCIGTVTANTGWLNITTGSRTSGNVVTLNVVQDPTASGYITTGTVLVVDGSSNSSFNTGIASLTVTAVTASTITYSQTGGAATTTGGLVGPQVSPTITIGSTTNQGSSGCAGTFKTNDQVTLSSNFTSSTETDLETSLGSGGYFIDTLANGGKITSDTTDLCATCGSQALTLDASASSSQVGINFSWDYSGIDNFVLLSGTYTQTFWAKIKSGTPTVTLLSQRNNGSAGINCSTATISVTSTWAQYTVNCTGAETKTTTPGSMRNHLLVTGGVIYFDNYNAFLQDSSTNILRATVLADMQNFKGDTCRYWIGQNGETPSNWYNANRFARKPTASGANNYYPNTVVVGLDDFLTAAQAIGCNPYVEFSPMFDNAEGVALVNHLSTAGWLSVFPYIGLSFGNEQWNPSFYQEGNGWSGVSNTLGNMAIRAGSIFAAMRAASGFNPAVIKLGINLQTGVNNSGDLSTAAANSKTDYFEQQGYTFTQADCAVTSFTSGCWQTIMAQANTMMINASDPTGFANSAVAVSALHNCGPSNTAQCILNVYEWAVSTWQGTANQATFDAVTAGAGQGTTAAGEYLLMQKTFPGQFPRTNYFGYAGYNGTSFVSNQTKMWGNTVDSGGGSGGNKRPQYITLAMVNNATLPNVIPCTITGTNTYNFAGDSSSGSNSVPATNGVTQVIVVCENSGQNRSEIFVNLTALTQTVNFTGDMPGSTTYVSYAPSSPNLLNEAASPNPTNNATANVSTTTGTLTAPTSVTLAPFAVYTMQWTTTVPASPVFSPVPATYPGATAVTITDATAGAKIFYTTNGATPDNLSALYSSPVTISTSATLSAIASTVTVDGTNLQGASGWLTCYIGSCAGGGTPGGSGTPTGGTVALTQGISSPSLSGASQLLTFATTQNTTNVLWYLKPAACDTCQTFTYDMQVYPNSGYANANAYEFDLFNYDISGAIYSILGTQWNKANGTWDIWNGAASGGGWVHVPAITAALTQNAWNHIQFSGTIDLPTSTACSGVPCMTYNYLVINGTTYTINQTMPSQALSSGTSAVGLNVQMDGGTVSSSTTFSEYIDQVHAQFAQPNSAVTSGTYTIGFPVTSGLAGTNAAAGTNVIK